jgi:hypothetical protein
MAVYKPVIDMTVFPFNEIPNTSINFGKGESMIVLNKETRRLEINIMMCLTLKYYVEVQHNTVHDLKFFIENNLAEQTILLYYSIFNEILKELCTRMERDINDIDWNKVDDYHVKNNSLERFQSQLLSNQELSFASSIIHFGVDDRKSSVAELVELISSFFKTDEILVPGSVIDLKYKLIKKLSPIDDNVENDKKSQVWKAEFRTTSSKFMVVLKFLPISWFFTEKQLKKMKTKKIVEEMQILNKDFSNMKLLNMFSDHMTKYKSIGYTSVYSMTYMVMDYLGTSIDKAEIRDKRECIHKLSDMILILHKHGYVFNNLCPAHIMLSDNVYKLVDFKRLAGFKSMPPDVSESGYASLSLLTGGFSTPHDDLESLFYIFDFILNRKSLNFVNREDEIVQKQALTFCSEKVRNIIHRIRSEKQNDRFINNEDSIQYPDKYVEAKTEAMLKESVNYLLDGFTEIIPLNIELTKGETELCAVLKAEMQNSTFFSFIQSPEEMDIMVLKIMFSIRDDVRYDDQTQMIIDRFLGIV